MSTQRLTMDASGNTVVLDDKNSSSDDSEAENVTVSSESNPSGISLKGETVDVGDLSIRKEDLILLLLVFNLMVSMYDN